MDIDSEDWGFGEVFYIYCSVEDIGLGLSEYELKFLF